MTGDARAQVVEVIVSYGTAFDGRDAEGVLACFSEDVRLEYFNGERVMDGIETAREFFDFDAHLGLPGLDRITSTTHHMYVGAVDIDGDAASVSTSCAAYLLGAVGSETVLVTRGVRYLDDLRRTPDGWRITRRLHLPEWETRTTAQALQVVKGSAVSGAGARADCGQRAHGQKGIVVRRIDGETAIVGVGSTDYYRRGASLPTTPVEMACQAIITACADAGIAVEDVDGFAYYSGGLDTPLLAQTLGLREVNFTAMLTGGGNGSAGAAGLAAAAIISGQAEIVVSVIAVQQPPGSRLGAAMVVTSGPYYRPPTPQKDFTIPYGLVAPGHGFSLLAQRHMYLYGTQREHFGEVCITQRANALARPKALHKTPLSLDEYMAARMISEPLCLFDYTVESDGAVAVVTTTAERARDLRHPPAYIMATAAGGDGRWSGGSGTTLMSDVLYPSAGAAHSARRLFGQAGVGPEDVDVALLYDHFSPMVLLQLEDYGFCGRGQSGPFVAEGNIRLGGTIPVNTHGGHLSEAYMIGMTHVVEAVEQIRGRAINQVDGCQIALATGGPSAIPTSSILLRR